MLQLHLSLLLGRRFFLPPSLSSVAMEPKLLRYVYEPEGSLARGVQKKVGRRKLRRRRLDKKLKRVQKTKKRLC